MITLIEVREVREATLFAMATIRSSCVMRAVSWLDWDTIDWGPEEGVQARGSTGRDVWVTTSRVEKTYTHYIFFHPQTCHITVWKILDWFNELWTADALTTKPISVYTWKFWSTSLSARCALADPRKRWTNAVQPKENWNSMFSWKSLQIVAQFRS